MASTEDAEIAILARKFALLNAVEHDGRANAGSVIGRILAENERLRKESSKVKPISSVETQRVNELSKENQLSILQLEFPGEYEKRIKQKKEISKSDSEKEPTLPDLPDALLGTVITRFPPEPNGFMHIGHAKAAFLGSEYAKKYGGEFIVRFDDTNPAAEKREYYDAFLRSLNWLGIIPTRIRSSSDDLPKFYALAEKMMSNGKAYVCSCSHEIMKENRSLGRACEHRYQSPEKNNLLWKEMLSGASRKSAQTLRFLGDMSSLNTTMRDPVLFRVVEERHPIQDGRFRVWPTYDFDGPVEDSLGGVTHAMRSKEYELRDELYYAILDSLNLRSPKIIEFSRLQLQNTTVSKRNLKKLIQEGLVDGWDDPRLPTISGLRRRGFMPEAIREFVLSMGLSKVESQPTWDLLESINRKIIDPIAKRYFFVEDAVRLEVENAPTIESSIKFHPEKSFGRREIRTEGRFLLSRSDAKSFSVGSKIRLIEAYNVEIRSVDHEDIRGRYLGTENIEKIPRIHWVAQESAVPFEVVVTGPLLIDEKYNAESLKVARGFAESATKDIPVNAIFQFVRFGFCRLDRPSVAILTHK